MSAMREDYKHMDVRGADVSHGFELLRFSPVTFFLPQESVLEAGDASILEKITLIALRIHVLSEHWSEIPIKNKIDIIAAIRFLCDYIKQLWRWTKYALLTARVIAKLLTAMG